MNCLVCHTPSDDLLCSPLCTAAHAEIARVRFPITEQTPEDDAFNARLDDLFKRAMRSSARPRHPPGLLAEVAPITRRRQMYRLPVTPADRNAANNVPCTTCLRVHTRYHGCDLCGVTIDAYHGVDTLYFGHEGYRCRDCALAIENVVRHHIHEKTHPVDIPELFYRASGDRVPDAWFLPKA